MTEPVNNGATAAKRDTKFKAGNGGRKVGSRNKRTLWAKAAEGPQGITAEMFAALVAKIYGRAMKGDTAAAKLLADRIWPPPKGRRVQLDLPDTSTIEGVAAAMTVLVQALGRGEVEPGEAQQIESVLETQRRALETHDLMRRVKLLERGR